MFLVLQVKVPLLLYLRLVAWQANSEETSRKSLQISHLLLHFSIKQLFSFIILGNKDGDMSSYKFLFLLYVTLIVLSGKICSISWLLCNTGKYFLKIVLTILSLSPGEGSFLPAGILNLNYFWTACDINLKLYDFS